MSKPKSRCDDLDEIAGKCMLVRHIAEPLASFDVEQDAQAVRNFMEEKSFDAVGVRRNGLVGQYVTRGDLHDGVEKLGDCVKEINDDSLIQETSGVKDALDRLCTRDFPLFVAGRNNHVWGIISRGDLRKAPVSMYLFGLVSLLEMQLTRLIRECHSQEAWSKWLKNHRVADANDLFLERRQNNEHIDLVDCLQFADKKDIVAKSSVLRERLKIETTTEAKRDLTRLMKLRNSLAHGQDVITAHWSELARLVKKAEELLRESEGDVESDPPAKPVLQNA